MQVGVWQLLIIALVVLVLFGRGRISEMMGDFGKGVNSFKKGLNDGEEPIKPAAKIEPPQSETTASPESKTTDQQG
ncbi:twin-arginine translocase TatA/TatE family subunit [Erythrobacter sp. SDW2]|uniref:twin-arginine translocase TatA/TatE family subunit n=1 Tax=Erythrobacter sp. SDW2 TaxID=2907154 RepID=UPI001F2348A6|nr:twin-arginine translocase TatA/TatE family subunit [Erythrobacter sp. SDW2]UIP06524.1 twin-arginine translocase TatA/TatE family subunit [Erythrobacter sp. SDW2]